MRITPLLTVCVIICEPGSLRAAESNGEQIYREMCSRCHGANGQGTKKAPQPLVGDKSVAQLAALIDRTMPEDDPDKLDAAGSKEVAQYIFDAFYSRAAQARISPPRIALSHLTVHQYRNAIADVVGSFRPAAKLDGNPGLRGFYYNSRNVGGKANVDRVDPEVNFDFGKSGPEAKDAKEKFDPHQFSIRWEGSVLAPETGLYEFILRTDHAARLWVNDNRQPVLDRWVKSGSDTEFRVPVFLLGGRAYPIRLEFSKAKQGVDDSKKNPNPPVKPAFLALAWKRPKGTDEVIPVRFLTTAKVPEVCVIESPFPPDDRSLGWERGMGVSKEWDAATTDGAIEAAGYVLARLPELAGAQPGSKDRGAKLQEFCHRFAERAFGRPLAPDEIKVIERQFQQAGDPDLATKRALLFMLKSPRFLFPEAANSPENYAVASRLALVLWDSHPDAELLAAAAAGKLTDRAEVVKQAERMLADPRAKAKIRELLFVWLKLDQTVELAKDTKRFPGFDSAVAADLRTSLELFLDEVVWSKSSDFRQFFLAEETYLNGRLSKFYGADFPADSPFRKVTWETGRRSGVVTHPYILAALAYNAESSPIHRGVFLARGMLGVTIRPPKEAFTPLAADLHPTLTTRERVSLQTKPAACAGCHGVMNPLGFALEHFDAVGRFREKEKEKPIDATGSYDSRTGNTIKFDGAKQLAKFLAESPEVPAAFVERLFHHLVKQPVMAYGITKPEELTKTFSESGFNVRKLVVEVAVTGAMPPRPPK
jgi:mono/diheme cytochrome c family protein